MVGGSSNNHKQNQWWEVAIIVTPIDCTLEYTETDLPLHIALWAYFGLYER